MFDSHSGVVSHLSDLLRVMSQAPYPPVEAQTGQAMYPGIYTMP